MGESGLFDYQTNDYVTFFEEQL